MLAQKIAGWAKRVLSSTRANGILAHELGDPLQQVGGETGDVVAHLGCLAALAGKQHGRRLGVGDEAHAGHPATRMRDFGEFSRANPPSGGMVGIGWGVSRAQQRREALRDGRAAVELRRGQAHGAPAVGGEHEVAFAVGLEGAPVAVVEPAVELGDQAVLRPVQVDLVAADEAVADRLRQAVLVRILRRSRSSRDFVGAAVTSSSRSWPVARACTSSSRTSLRTSASASAASRASRESVW